MEKAVGLWAVLLPDPHLREILHLIRETIIYADRA